MKELDFIEIIKNTLTDSSRIGDDCAHLSELGIVVTHDTLVEDVHFSLKYSSAFQLGYKSIMVNLSDIFASGAKPKYLTISLSLPASVDSEFVSEFYRASDILARKFDFQVVGGDITSADKIFVSVCAIGITSQRKISSRKNAKINDYVITTGVHGSSAAGLWLLQNDENIDGFESLVDAHLEPVAQQEFSDDISTKLTSDYAMMDSSDGLVDAVFKIAKASNVMISLDFAKIHYDKKIEDVAKFAKKDFRDWILYGGEDFQLVACVSDDDLDKISAPYFVIGRVLKNSNSVDDSHFVEINLGDEVVKISDLEKTFNHFKENL